MNQRITKVALISGYGLLLETLCIALERRSEIEVVATGKYSSEAVEIARRGAVHALLLETSSIADCDVLDMISRLCRLEHGPGLLMLSMVESRILAMRMIRCGAKGVLARNADLAQVAEALECAAQGEIYLTRELEYFCARRLLRPDAGSSEGKLTDRELQVMRLLALGRTNREAAATLGISIKTVDSHRGNLLRKLGLRNNSDLTRFAIQAGIVECEVLASNARPLVGRLRSL